MPTERTYKDSRSLEMAIKAAAKKSDQDTGKAIEAYYPGRLLERIFSEPEPSFVLKGGRSILARIVDARYTRDTDLLYKGANIEEAINELKRLATIDLGDFLEFRFVSAQPITVTQQNRNGYRVVFTPVLGGTKSMSDVFIDLVVDQIASGTAERVQPANRLNIEGLTVFDYFVYPVASSVSDKVCAILQTHSNVRASSRIRDLVDLVVYLTTMTFDGRDSREQLVAEFSLRGISNVADFNVPASWYENHESQFAKIANEAHLPEEYCTIANAERLAKSCIDPVIKDEVDDMVWSPDSLEWERR